MNQKGLAKISFILKWIIYFCDNQWRDNDLNSVNDAQIACKKALATLSALSVLNGTQIKSKTEELATNTLLDLAKNNPNIIIKELQNLIKLLGRHEASIRAVVTNILDILSVKDAISIEKFIPELERYLNNAYIDWSKYYENYDEVIEEEHQFCNEIINPLRKVLIQINTRLNLPKSLPRLVAAYGPRIPIKFLVKKANIDYDPYIPDLEPPELLESFWYLDLEDFESTLASMIFEGIISGRIDLKKMEFISFSTSCHQCGKPTQPQSKFCSFCGIKLND